MKQLYYYLLFETGEITRKEAIEKTSRDLRTMASNKQIEIDNVYRNTNGITFQMHSMESAYKGITVIKPASKLFLEIVSIFNTNKEEYNKLLKEARDMITVEKDNLNEFATWLSNRVSPAQLSELYMSYEEIEKFCMKINVLTQPLLQTTETATLKKVQSNIERNKIFRFKHKRQLNKIYSAMKQYITYVQEKNESKPITSSESNHTDGNAIEEKIVVQTAQDKNYSTKYPLIYKKIFKVLRTGTEETQNEGMTVVSVFEKINKIARCETIKTILDGVSWAYSEENLYYFSKSEVEKELKDKSESSNAIAIEKEVIGDEQTQKICFDAISDLSYTKPLRTTYFEEALSNTSSWKQVYVEVFKKMYEKHKEMIPLNQSFGAKSGRMDFCTDEYHFSMNAPRKIDENRYLETNLSETDIVRKIKLLMDTCHIGYNNLLIEYEKKIENQANIDFTVNKTVSNVINSDSFFEWLSNEEKIAPPTSRSYVSAVNTAEKFAIKSEFINCALYSNNYEISKATANELFDNKIFIEYNEKQHNRFRFAINKLLKYIENSGNGESIVKQKINLEPFEEILIEKFPRGYRIDSPIELRKFKRYWEEIHNSSITVDEVDISKKIRLCGVLYEGQVYMPQKMIDESTKLELFSYINSSFQEGKSLIYFEALFKELSNDFLDHCMYNSSMLREYLIYENCGEYHIAKNYISQSANVSVDPYEEIKNCLIEHTAPMNYDDMFEKLSHIPEKKVRSILAQNKEFISNGKGEYFHISVVALSSDELDDIANIIQSLIADKQFISGNELIDSIKSKYPYIIEQNTLISDKGLRDAIGYMLKDKFTFNGNIISSKEQSLTMIEVFADFCKNRDTFTLSELKVLKQELNTIIYFDVVYENSLRINKNEFVSKTHASFNIEETDKAIDRYCNEEYISIGKIKQFSFFPDAGFPWNSYLLEGYVAMYSPNYKLLHSNYNEGACVGGIVKKLSDIDTFDELLIDVIAKNGLSLQKESALQYLCDEGYLARRKYTSIEQVLIKAKELRNQKGL